MSIIQHPKSRIFEADVRDRAIGRLHLSLATRVRREADRRHAALEALVREGHADLVQRLRRRTLNIQAVTATFEARRPFDTLRAGFAWPTLGVAVEEYLAWIRTHADRADNTARLAETHLSAARDALGGDRPVDTITHDDVAAWRTALADGRAPVTVTRYLQKLATLYAWLNRREERRAAEEKRAPKALHSPVDRELLTDDGTPRIRFLSTAEATQLVAATPDRLRFPIAVGLLAGLRIGEMLHLTPADVDLELGLVVVREKAAPWLPRKVWRPKSRKRREVPMTDDLVAAARVHLASFADEAWILPSGSLKRAYAGRPLSERAFSTHVTEIVTNAGLVPGRDETDGVTYHTLRHTFASWLVMARVDLFTVSRLMGHSSTAEVERTYGHLSPEHRRQAVAVITERFRLDGDVTEPPSRDPSQNGAGPRGESEGPDDDPDAGLPHIAPQGDR